MNEQTEMVVSNKVACPYYGGLVKEGKSTHIKCGNDKLLHQHPGMDSAKLFKNDKCLGIAGSDRYHCRAFLMQSIQDKKINVGSDLCIPELQEIYDQVKDRPGCGECEHYWWSAGYKHRDCDGKKIPCDSMTHYCRQGMERCYKITDQDLWFCIRKPQKNESEENNMQTNTNASATIGDTDLHVITPSTELTDATQLHQRIMAGIEVAANALIDVCRNLKTMRDKKLYTQLGYESFEDYAEQAVGMKRRQAYNYIQVLEKLPSSTLQDNAHIGITKLELLSQVPALDREDFLEENNVDNMPVREMEELVKQIKDQGEQISLLQTENNESKTAKNNQEAELAKAREELQAAQDRAAELESQLEDTSDKEPDEETLEKIREEARAAVEAETAEKIKKAESAAKSDADTKIKKIQSEQDERIKKAQEQAAKDAAAKLQKSLDAAETDKSEALKRAIELEKQLKIAGDPDAVLIQHHFSEIQRSFNQIVETIEKKQTGYEMSSGKKAQIIEDSTVIPPSFQQLGAGRIGV